MPKCRLITGGELLNKVKELSDIYDVVRIVEPVSSSVVKIEGSQVVKEQLEPCFSVWGREERCDNCTSLRACLENRRLTKFEFKNDEVFSVVSVPYQITDIGDGYKVSLELVNHVVDDVVMQAQGEGMMVDAVEKMNQRIYEDSLTGVYNRRYYDESRYIYEMTYSLPRKIAFLVIDVNHFKNVNDTYGHAHGDNLLSEIASTLKATLRQSDKVIRVGGDEFLAVIRDCSKASVEKQMGRLREAVHKISLDWATDYMPSVAIGMEYTNHFDGSKQQIDALFEAADKNMYLNKNSKIHEKKRMLVVDDLPINRDVLKEYFNEEFDVYEAQDGLEALDVLKKHSIEVMITDIYMPNMDGLTLTETVRKTPEIENIIIFVVTDRGEEFELKALDAGADDFINKPFNMELLNHRIKGVLSQNTVSNRISQYQLSFNQNQIPFATVKVYGKQIVYEYVNDAFAQMMHGTPEQFVSGRKNLHFKGFYDFICKVAETHKRNTFTVFDDMTGNYYDIIAYAQDNKFCSFIVLTNYTMRTLEVSSKKYTNEFDELTGVNPNTLGALFVDLTANLCNKGYGTSKYMECIEYPVSYTDLVEKLSLNAASVEAKNKFLAFADRDKLIELYKNGIDHFELEVPAKMLNGSIHWLGIYITLIQNCETEQIEEILYATDIHARKLSQLVIDIVSRKNFDTLFCVDTEAWTAQVYMGDGNIYWSQPVPVKQIDESVASYLQKHYIGDDKEQFIKDNYISVIANKIKDVDHWSIDYTLLEDDGRKHLKRGTYYWLDTSKTILCFTREDITDAVEKEKIINRKLQETNRQLTIASNAKMEFLSRMSHDIRTPMNTIIGLSSLAVDEVNNPDKMMEYINNISEAGKFLLGLVNDILDMDKINRGQMELNYEPYAYEEFLQTLKIMFEPMCAQNKQKFLFEDADTKLVVITDKVRLNQIFFNVISNAIKYTPSGGTISYKTENLKVSNDKVSCDYLIQDTGIGMSEEFQSKMFQEFSQESKDNQISSKGTGLGLAITKSLVEMMDGTISITSKEGMGTTVRIHMEFEISNTDVVQHMQDYYNEDEKVLRDKNILLVEDHPLNQKIGKEILSKKGMHVFCADNGREAVEKYASSRKNFFHAILMDVRMPIMNGIQATRKIRQLERADAAVVPIIAMTANAYDEDRRITKEAGMNEHLSKPINPDELYHTLYQCTRK